MRFQLDGSWQRFDRAVIAGSPLKIFRTTDAGAAVLDSIERGTEVEHSTLIDRLLDAGAIHPDFESGSARTFTRADVTVVTPQLGGVAATDGRIVVDDGSVPPIPGATLRLDDNLGPAAARNSARSLVTTPLVAFVDADVDLLDDVGGCWLDCLLPHFDDPKVGLVAPRVAGEDDSAIDLGTEPGRLRIGTRLSYAPTAAVVMRVDMFDELGGFDPALRYGEDVDFVWRLDETEWRCRYEPKAVVWHEPRQSLVERMRQHAEYGTSAAPLSIRHPHALSPVRTNGWTAGAWGAAALGHPVIGAALGVGSSVALIPKLRDVPALAAFKLAMTGNLFAAKQFGAAFRRDWWPLLLLAALFSKRARHVALVAIALAPASVPTDVAYGSGVWRGMLKHRTLRPITPRLVAWPGRRPR